MTVLATGIDLEGDLLLAFLFLIQLLKLLHLPLQVQRAHVLLYESSELQGLRLDWLVYWRVMVLLHFMQQVVQSRLIV